MMEMQNTSTLLPGICEDSVHILRSSSRMHCHDEYGITFDVILQIEVFLLQL